MSRASRRSIVAFESARPTRLLKTRDMTERRHELRKMNAEFEWLERYGLARQYAWEKIPIARVALGTTLQP